MYSYEVVIIVALQIQFDVSNNNPLVSTSYRKSLVVSMSTYSLCQPSPVRPQNLFVPIDILQPTIAWESQKRSGRSCWPRDDDVDEDDDDDAPSYGKNKHDCSECNFVATFSTETSLTLNIVMVVALLLPSYLVEGEEKLSCCRGADVQEHNIP